MKTPWTIQVGLARYWGATVTVEAESLEAAIPAAIREADDKARWDDTGDASDPFAVAACRGAGADPWDGPVSVLPIPDRFTEQGEPPVIMVIDPANPTGRIEVTRGRVLIRFESDAGALTSELRAPSHPPADKPLVTVRRRADGRPDVTVTEGRARVRILDD